MTLHRIDSRNTASAGATRAAVKPLRAAADLAVRRLRPDLRQGQQILQASARGFQIEAGARSCGLINSVRHRFERMRRALAAFVRSATRRFTERRGIARQRQVPHQRTRGIYEHGRKSRCTSPPHTRQRARALHAHPAAMHGSRISLYEVQFVDRAAQFFCQRRAQIERRSWRTHGNAPKAARLFSSRNLLEGAGK